MIGDSRLAVLGKADSVALQQHLSDMAAASYIDGDGTSAAMAEGWSLAVDQHLNNGGLDEDDERKLLVFADRFGLSRELLDRKGYWTKVVKAGVIRDLLNGVVPQRVKANGNLPFTLMANEKLVWLFSGVKYLEGQTPPANGGYHGARVEVAKGQYYRPVGFCDNPVETAGRTHIDSGFLAVTTRHFYFGGRDRRLRVRHDQIVSFTPYTDGVGIQPDADAARPHVFVTGDGWFTYNLLANIGNVSGW